MDRFSKITVLIAYALLVFVVAWSSWFIRTELNDAREIQCATAALVIADMNDIAHQLVSPEQRQLLEQRVLIITDIFESTCSDSLGDAKKRVDEVLKGTEPATTTTTSTSLPSITSTPGPVVTGG